MRTGSGAAMAVWSTNKQEIRSARLSDASPYWGAEEILHTISPSRNSLGSVTGSISDTGARFAAWEDYTDDESDAFAAAALN